MRLKAMDIDHFYDDKIDEGYSAAYIRHMHNLLRQAFEQAVKWELIKSNPVVNAKPPKVKNPEKTTWNIEEVNRFLTTVKNKSYGIAYILAIFTGMRRGEILGLKWEDITFGNKKIHIKRSVSYVQNKGLLVKEPKTSKSKRQISISEHVINQLKTHKEKQLFTKDNMGYKYEDNDFVITTENGKPINPRNLLRQFYEMMEKAQVPRISFHDLRHTHATIMMEQGENPKVVSERLGHSRVAVTLDLYSHVSDDLQEKAATKFEQTLFNRNNS
ncbi:tyrosine-type recombinase/integrase [Heyndrickxia acidicola]|uniref:Site-specific integrase n=1 Tax=Heyndrickxia acidicola TaxID=209389 RepID=A0ABU6ME44_9BACI|nr:site-specific integrase [Heyndrickxia acidicola]MED1202574.1 site-specific integrase [Heyndrickxia acidicola]